VQEVSTYPALAAGEQTVSCNSSSDRAIGGADVPEGLSYSSLSANNGEYRTEWSGPASDSEWDWYFSNASVGSITLAFIVYCQPG
jgi:hypothetical protein